MSMRPQLSVVKRHLYEMRHTPAEVWDLLYWPFFDLLAWGLLTSFLQSGDVELPIPILYLIGAALMWNVFWRVQNDIALTFLGDVWSDNVIALFASPITPGRYLAGAMLWTLMRLGVQWAVMAGLAWTVFHFGIFSLGVALVPFMASLMLFGVAMALVVLGVIIRVGHGANALAWGLAGVVQPLSAVYYPMSILPAWGQWLSRMLPTSYIFEAMRQVLAGGPVPWELLALTIVMDGLYIAAAVWFVRRMWETLRVRGLVTRYA
jgi:ABC-2 type transport system permease protein